MTRRHCSISAVILMLVLSASSNAAIIELTANNGLQSFFDGNISSIDLIQAGSPTLSGTVVASAPAAFPETGSNDGTAINSSGLTYWNGVNSAGQDLTFTLAGSATGYDITSVNSIYGWQDSRSRHSAQQWTLEVATVSNPTFTPLHSVVYTPFAPTDNAEGSTQVTLTDTAGVIVSGVTAVRFHIDHFSSPGSTGFSGELGVIRELDVFGAPTAVPEPNMFLGFGLSGILAMVGLRRLK